MIYNVSTGTLNHTIPYHTIPHTIPYHAVLWLVSYFYLAYCCQVYLVAAFITDSFLTISQPVYNIRFSATMPRECIYLVIIFRHTPLTYTTICLRHAYLNPLDSLKLWINDERPSFSIRQYSGILRRHPVAWKSFVVPLGDLRVVGQQRQRVKTFRERNWRNDIRQIRDPVFLHEFQSIRLGEVADVRYEGCSE